MDEIIDQKKDLIDFINNEILNIVITNNDLLKINKLMNKSLIKTLIDITTKTQKLNNLNLNETITNGLNMIYYIFIIMLSYTKNIKLTMFFTERAILLYTEFIVMSRNPILNNDLNFTPNINDALQFVYKKTIGPIKINQLNNNSQLYILKQSGLDIKNILLKLQKYNIYKDEIYTEYSILYEDIISFLSNQLIIIYQLDNFKDISYHIHNIINDFLNVNIDNLLQYIYLLKTYLEVFDFVYTNINCLDKTINIMKYIYLELISKKTLDNISINNTTFKEKKTLLFKKYKNSYIEYLHN